MSLLVILKSWKYLTNILNIETAAIKNVTYNIVNRLQYFYNNNLCGALTVFGILAHAHIRRQKSIVLILYCLSFTYGNLPIYMVISIYALLFQPLQPIVSSSFVKFSIHDLNRIWYWNYIGLLFRVGNNSRIRGNNTIHCSSSLNSEFRTIPSVIENHAQYVW